METDRLKSDTMRIKIDEAKNIAVYLMYLGESYGFDKKSQIV